MREIFHVQASSTSFQQKINAGLPDVLCNLREPNKKSSQSIPAATRSRQENFPLAIEVNNVCKTYGETGDSHVLNGFSMQVPHGAIYSLLGASGSGKTTALSCIVGLKNWDSGSISVLGLKQAMNCSSVAYLAIGKQIGYMPQELALYEHLTAKEILQYFGNLYDLTDEEIDIRWRTLAKLLDLSSKRFALIQDLSCGQKRRISLALALVARSPVIVLDEPTVGLDALLRTRVWDHLKELAQTHKTTVLITTHYVEEAKCSNMIGVMRNGRMLVEDSPQAILTTYKSDLLQDSILQICKNDQMSRTVRDKNLKIAILANSYNPVVFQYKGRISLRSSIDLPDIKCKKDTVTFSGFKKVVPNEVVRGSSNYSNYKGKMAMLDIESDSQYYGAHCERLKSSARKSIMRTVSFSRVMWIYLLRQPIFAFILLFLPAIQLFMTFYVVGREPTNLQLGIINLEVLTQSTSTQSVEDICRNVSFRKRTCELNLLSCHIEKNLMKNKRLDLVHLAKKEVADEMLQEGAIFGYLTFPRNYSTSLVNRFMWGRFTSDNDTFEDSTLRITLDKSHYMAYHIIIKEIFDALNGLSKDLEAVCGFDQYAHEIPLHYRVPVFGKLNGTHQEGIMPAIVAQILFEIMFGIAPMILIKDLKQGTFARSNLAGLRFSEFMLGIFTTLGPILILQSISCYLVLQHCFSFDIRGSFFLFILLCLVAGLCGQGFGIFVGIIVKCELAVIVSAIMVVPILMTCSGTLWPLESHPGYLMTTYYIFPSALIVSSLRSVVNRGVGITHALVWPGLVNSLSWTAVFWVLSICGLKKMTKT